MDFTLLLIQFANFAWHRTYDTTVMINTNGMRISNDAQAFANLELCFFWEHYRAKCLYWIYEAIFLFPENLFVFFFWLLFFDLLICLSLLFIMCQCFYSLHQFLLIYVFARIVVIVNHWLLIIYFDQSNENWVASEKDKTILRERASISNSSWM